MVAVIVQLIRYRHPRWYAAASGLEDADSIKIDFIKDLLWDAEVVLDEKEWGKGRFLDVICQWILCVHPNRVIAGKDLNCLTEKYMFGVHIPYETTYGHLVRSETRSSYVSEVEALAASPGLMPVT